MEVVTSFASSLRGWERLERAESQAGKCGVVEA